MRSIAGISLFLAALLVVPLFLSACGGEDPYDVLDQGGPLKGSKATPSEIQVPILSDQAGQAMLGFKCVTCHTKTPIKKSRLSKLEWEARVQRCIDKPDGAKISPMDAKSLVNWLANKYGN